MAGKKGVHRNGVYFDCEEFGKLLRYCTKHHSAHEKACPGCGGDLKLVGVGTVIDDRIRHLVALPGMQEAIHTATWRNGGGTAHEWFFGFREPAATEMPMILSGIRDSPGYSWS